MNISPSQVQSFKLCMRKWAFKVILGIPERQTAAQDNGIVIHKRLERVVGVHEAPGTDAIGRLVQSAMRPGILPAPSTAVLVEHEFFLPLGDDPLDKFHGFIDCLVPPTEAELRALVIDYKTTKSLHWAKTVGELQDDPQNVGYSKAALELFPQALEIEARWIYLQVNSTLVRPVSIVRTAVEVEAAWQSLKALALEMLKLRKRKVDPEQLPGCEEACGMFGGCTYLSRCSIGRAPRGFGFPTGKVFTNSANKANVPDTGEPAMSSTLLEQLHQLRAAQAAPAPVQAVAPAPAPAPAPSAPVQAVAPAPVQAVAPAPVASPSVATPGTLANVLATQAPAPAPAAAVGQTTLQKLQGLLGLRGVNPPAPAPAQAAPTAINTAVAAAVAAPAAVNAAAAAIIAGPAMPAQTVAALVGGVAGAPTALPIGPPPASLLPDLNAPIPDVEAASSAQIAALTDALEAPVPDALAATEADLLAELTKKPRKKREAKAPPSQPPSQPAPEPASRLTVLFNCAILKRPGDAADPVQLIDLLGPIMRAVADQASKAHWLLIPYNDGKAMLAHAFDQWLDESGWKGTVFVDEASMESMAVREVLLAHADVVVRGLG